MAAIYPFHREKVIPSSYLLKMRFFIRGRLDFSVSIIKSVYYFTV